MVIQPKGDAEEFKRSLGEFVIAFSAVEGMLHRVLMHCGAQDLSSLSQQFIDKKFAGERRKFVDVKIQSRLIDQEWKDRWESILDFHVEVTNARNSFLHRPWIQQPDGAYKLGDDGIPSFELSGSMLPDLDVKELHKWALAALILRGDLMMFAEELRQGKILKVGVSKT